MLDAAPAAGGSRGNSPAPRVGLPLPPQAALPASSFQPFPGAGRGGPAAAHVVATDGHPTAAQPAMTQAMAGQCPPSSATCKRFLTKEWNYKEGVRQTPLIHTLPEDHEGGSEDGYGGEEDDTAPLEDHGYGGEEDDTAPLEDDDGDQDDCGAASEDSDDDIVPLGRRAVQLLAIRANFHICAINCYDWRLAQCIYSQHEMEVQEEGMVDLVPFGPRSVLEAYGSFTLEVFHSITIADSTTTTGNEGSSRVRYSVPIKVEWDVCDEDDDDLEPEKYIQTICGRGPGRKMEITFLVIPNAIVTKVEVQLKLKDLGSRSHAVYGKIKASTADYGNKSVHLFSCERGNSWSVPSGPTSILPLSPAKIALPYRRQLELNIEVDLIVIRVFDNQEEYKNLKFSLTFTRGIRSQERQVDGDQVVVSIAFSPKI